MQPNKSNIDHFSCTIPAASEQLTADASLPEDATGLVIFSHGSGSSRHSPRNRFVAEKLNDGGLGTILIDLLTPQEEAIDRDTAELRFDVPLLGRRLVAIVDWISRQPRFKGLRLGIFGASTGAAAALLAAAARPTLIGAVVSRGGRPDLAEDALPRVTAPTLFIVGGEDPVVLDLNRHALRSLPHAAKYKLEVISGATHLFEERGALDRVAELAGSWFQQYLATA